MRRILLSVLLLALITLVHAGSTPMPRSSIPNLVEARQVKRAELVARQKYPDLFRKRDDVPSTGNNPCPNFAKRDFVALQVLSASEAAAFLKGRGSFTSNNGTTYVDEVFAETLRSSMKTEVGRFRGLYNVVKDSIGNKLLEISIPHYKTWKKTLVHGEVINLSRMTGIRTEDIDELEQLLLADPEFVDVQVLGFRVNRRFFEAALSY